MVLDLIHIKNIRIFSLPLISLIILLAVPSTYGQSKAAEQHQKFDQVYGLNPDLYNGRKYFRDNYGAIGHPYWIGEVALPARLTSGSKTYNNLSMKYELNKQFFILEFFDYNDAVQMIILNDYAIDTVYLNDAVFIRNPFEEINNKYVQLINTGYYSAFISCTKQFQYQSMGVHTGYKYSEEIKERFLVTENKVYPFRNKRTFLNVFEKGDRKEIKAFISSNKIKFKKLTDMQFKELTAFCNEAYQ